MSLEFEWDPEKAEANSQKHGIDFDEAWTIFFDPRQVTLEDVVHSDEEDRFDHRYVS